MTRIESPGALRNLPGSVGIHDGLYGKAKLLALFRLICVIRAIRGG